jgi:hypothetical protein
MSVDTQMKAVVQESRDWVEDQIDELSKQVKQLQKRSRKQVKQLQKQSRKLRKSLQREARKRRAYWSVVRVLLPSMRKYLQNQGENLRGRLVEQGGKGTQNEVEFAGKTPHDSAERGGGFTQGLAKQGQKLLEPIRSRNRTFWSIVGFSIGLLAAGTITYQLVRRRVAQQEIEQEEPIELPLSNSWDGSGSRPIGEISYLDQEGASVATLEIVDLETMEQPADAEFVGVKSTKLYYPIETELEPKDLVYFSTEEEAKTQGFNAAQ